jgi:uncharacterized protein (DUF983 family)
MGRQTHLFPDFMGLLPLLVWPENEPIWKNERACWPLTIVKSLAASQVISKGSLVDIQFVYAICVFRSVGRV